MLLLIGIRAKEEEEQVVVVGSITPQTKVPCPCQRIWMKIGIPLPHTVGVQLKIRFIELRLGGRMERCDRHVQLSKECLVAAGVTD